MKNLLNSLVFNTDSYKLSHYVQYPPNTTNVFSYIESRGSKISNSIMFFGLQYFIKKYLSTPVTHKEIDIAVKFAEAHGTPFNEEGWRHIVNECGGMLPLRIKAIPEGMVIPLRNVMVTIEATDPKCYWLPSYMETALHRAV